MGNVILKKKLVFFDEVDELLLDKLCIKLKVIIKFVIIFIDGNDDEEKIRVENVELNVIFFGSSKEKLENFDKFFNCVIVVIGKSYKMFFDWRVR